MSYKFSERSWNKLEGVHPKLVAVTSLALAKSVDLDFTVLEGVRTLERQKTLVANGASQTLNSKHLKGRAVDLGAWVDGEVSWHWSHYDLLASAMKDAAGMLNIRIKWGGDWINFKDGPHFELDDSEL